MKNKVKHVMMIAGGSLGVSVDADDVKQVTSVERINRKFIDKLHQIFPFKFLHVLVVRRECED